MGDDFMVMFNTDAITEEELKECMSTVGQKLTAAYTVKRPDKRWFILPKNCGFHPRTTQKWGDGRKELSQDFVVLGRHPRLIYEIWMKKAIVKKLDPRFRPDPYEPQGDIQDDCYIELKKLQQAPEDMNQTTTIITNQNISAARNYPRSSQDVVMEHTANEVCNAP